MENWWPLLWPTRTSRAKYEKTFQFTQRTYFELHFKSKSLLTSSSLSVFQPAIATDTPDAVVSIWSSTSSLAVFREEFVWIVDMIRPDDTVIIAEKDSTAIRRSQSATKRRADVSTRFRFLQRAFNDFSTASRLLSVTSSSQIEIYFRSKRAHKRLIRPISTGKQSDRQRFSSRIETWRKPELSWGPEGY